IARAENVHFIAPQVIEVLSPEGAPIGRGCDMQRASTAANYVRNTEFLTALLVRNDGTRSRRDQVPRREHRQRVQAVPKQAGTVTRFGSEPPPPTRRKLPDLLPNYRGSRCPHQVSAQQSVSARCIQSASLPGQDPQPGEPGNRFKFPTCFFGYATGGCGWHRSVFRLQSQERSYCQRVHARPLKAVNSFLGPANNGFIFVKAGIQQHRNSSLAFKGTDQIVVKRILFPGDALQAASVVD